MEDAYRSGALREKNVNELVHFERGGYFIGDDIAVVFGEDAALLHVREQQRHIVDVLRQLQPVAADDVAFFARRGLGV